MQCSVIDVVSNSTSRDEMGRAKVNDLLDFFIGKYGASIRGDFNGIGMGHYREELRNRLDHVLGQLDLGWEYLHRHRTDLYRLDSNTEITKDRYRELKRALQEVDGEAMEILTRTPSRFIILFGILTSVDMSRISSGIQYSCVASLTHVRNICNAPSSFVHGFRPSDIPLSHYSSDPPTILLLLVIYHTLCVPLFDLGVGSTIPCNTAILPL